MRSFQETREIQKERYRKTDYIAIIKAYHRANRPVHKRHSFGTTPGPRYYKEPSLIQKTINFFQKFYNKTK